MTHPTRAYGQPPAPPRRGGLHPLAIVGIVFGVVTLLCLGAVAIVAIGGGGEDREAGSGRGTGSNDSTTNEDAPPGIGEPARDGKFEFVVTEYETGVERVGGEFTSREPQGQFVLVHMTVENIGDRAQTFRGGDQKLIDSEGREHSADTAAARRIEDSDSFYTEINPGNKVEGIVVFDIPADATPVALELHDSILSGGVDVTLADAGGES